MSEISSKAKKFTSKANIVEGEPFRPPQNNKKYDPRGKGKFYNKNNPNPQIQKKKKRIIVSIVVRQVIMRQLVE